VDAVELICQEAGHDVSDAWSAANPEDRKFSDAAECIIEF